MKIGLLSDTHGYFDPKINDYFSVCDEIWHAGDIGYDVADKLDLIKPTKMVFGNIDDPGFQRKYPEDLHFQCEGLSVLITHIGGAPPNYNPRVKRLLTTAKPDIFICGHSHILRIKRDPKYNGMLYINPGAAGNHGFHHMKTIVRFEIIGKEVKNMEVIELGKRGALG